MIKIWHISDTHGFHKEIKVPEGIDIVIHSGDISNYRGHFLNTPECMAFLEWYQELPIKHKVLVAGNHDTSIERRYITPADIHARGITYLENESTTIEGLSIWGSPITPTFGTGWAWNKDRAKIDDVWKHIPEGTDIVITHGPPKGILDFSYNREGTLEMCGCRALMRNIERIKPMFNMFGHIHNFKDIENSGYRTVAGLRTIFSNGACVEDGRFDKGAISFGNIFEI